VDAPDDDYTARTVEVTGLDGDDRPAVDRAAEHDRPATDLFLGSGRRGTDTCCRQNEKSDKREVSSHWLGGGDVLGVERGLAIVDAER
jgi:hypothetical protein